MKTSRSFGLVVAIALILPIGAMADTAKAPAASQAKTPAPLVCPVTGDTIPSIKDAAGHSTYKGKTYYFCCSMCKPMFDKNPEKYIKAMSSQSSSKSKN